MSSYRDHYGRSLEYLRVSVTDRCNFRCPYCRPETGELYDPPADHLKAAEIARVVDVSRQLGVRAVRFTGGEPLLRRDLPDVIAAVRDLGVTDLALTTNAWRLAKRTKSLWQAGLRRINISLDALSKDRFRRLSGGLENQHRGDSRGKQRRTTGVSPIRLGSRSHPPLHRIDANRCRGSGDPPTYRRRRDPPGLRCRPRAPE